MQKNPKQCGWKIRGGWTLHTFFGGKLVVRVKGWQNRTVKELWKVLDENGRWPATRNSFAIESGNPSTTSKSSWESLGEQGYF
jgi:hypothetical protein